MTPERLATIHALIESDPLVSGDCRPLSDTWVHATKEDYPVIGELFRELLDEIDRLQVLHTCESCRSTDWECSRCANPVDMGDIE